MVLLCLRRYLTFFNGIWSSVMLYREYPEKSFKSFSLLANALPVGIPAEGLGSGILQLGVECFSRTDLPPILRESFFLKDIFRLKHFTMHILQPECRRAGRLRAGWKIWRKNKAFRHVDAVMGKNNRSNFKKLLFFQWKRPVLFFKDLVLFGKEQDLLRVSNVYAGRLVTCHPTRY